MISCVFASMALAMAIDRKPEIILYQTQDGKVKIDCRFAGDTLWFTQAPIADLFGRDISVISRHIKKYSQSSN